MTHTPATIARARRPAFVALAVVLALSALPAASAGKSPSGASVPAAAIDTSSAFEDFEGPAASWRVRSGVGELSFPDQDPSPSSGTRSARIGYDFRDGSTSVSIGPDAEQGVIPLERGLPRTVSVDVLGDGSLNVARLQLRDSTGELFHYSLGALRPDEAGQWVTRSIHPGETEPTTTLGGDGDGVLDLPVSVHRLLVDRNGEAGPSSVGFDAVRVTADAGSALIATPDRFSPSNGQRTTLKLTLDTASTYTITLTDINPGGTPRTRTFSGAHPGLGETEDIVWDGKANDGSLMRGSIQARLEVANGPDYDYPYFAGATLRPPTAVDSPAGSNTYLNKYLASQRATAEAHARVAEDSRIRTVREQFAWSLIEPANDDWRWERMDQMVELHRAHNLQIVGLLAYSTQWASSAPSDVPTAERQYYTPDLDAYEDYVRRVVTRYKDRVKYWQIWNEENGTYFYRVTSTDENVKIRTYTQLLTRAYDAIKAVDPTAKVLNGALAGGPDQRWLAGIYANGGWSKFDILAFHTYEFAQPESSMIPLWLDQARATLKARGTPTRPIWITEFGWSTGAPTPNVTEAQQAQYLARAYLLMARAGVQGILWYNLIEYGQSTSRLDNYGLVERAGGDCRQDPMCEAPLRKKPGYFALRNVAEPLDGGRSAGVADPNVGTRTTYGIEGATGWTVARLGTTGTHSVASVATPVHGGTSALKVTYDFGSGGTGLEVRKSIPLGTSTTTGPSSVSLWVFGDGSANPLYLKVADRCNEVYSARVGSLLEGWQRVTLFFENVEKNYQYTGGTCGTRGRLEYPLTFRAATVLQNGGIGVRSGSFVIDDVQGNHGPRVRGLVISRRNEISQSLYTLGGSVTQTVPVTGSDAWLVDGDARTRLTVSGGKVTVTLDATPKNIISGPTVSPTSFSHPGRAALSWVSGDRTRYVFQVLNPSNGAILRNIVLDGHTDAGIRSVWWDGRLPNQYGTLYNAAHGLYTLRVGVRGADGRFSYLYRDVAVR
jgi:large repetitive protein